MSNSRALAGNRNTRIGILSFVCCIDIPRSRRRLLLSLRAISSITSAGEANGEENTSSPSFNRSSKVGIDKGNFDLVWLLMGDGPGTLLADIVLFCFFFRFFFFFTEASLDTVGILTSVCKLAL